MRRLVLLGAVFSLELIGLTLWLDNGILTGRHGLTAFIGLWGAWSRYAEHMPKDKVSKELSEHLRELGRKGGKRRLETMTPQERSVVAKKAGAASAEVRTSKAKKRAAAGDEKPPVIDLERNGDQE